MTIFYSDESVTLHHGKAIKVLRTMPADSIDCCVSSPPYWGLRDYGIAGQQGLESTPGKYVLGMRNVFREVRRVIKDDGTLWLNLGDSYAVRWGSERRDGRRGFNHEAERGRSGPIGHELREKNLMGMPWRVAFALQTDGWILRNAIIWHKPNAMPESVQDRLANKYEHLFMFSKAPRYWFDLNPIREPRAEATLERYANGATEPSSRYGSRKPESRLRDNTGVDVGRLNPNGKNPGDVWSISTQPFTDAHFAVFPVELAKRAIQSGCKSGGTVLDPYSGSGTCGLAAGELGMRYIGIDLNREYLEMSLRTRLAQKSIVDTESVSTDAHINTEAHDTPGLFDLEETA